MNNNVCNYINGIIYGNFIFSKQFQYKTIISSISYPRIFNSGVLKLIINQNIDANLVRTK